MQTYSVVMLGGTGAVGGHVVKTLLEAPELERLTLLGRRPVEGLSDARVHQKSVDITNPSSYADYLPAHQVGICTLGVGQPAKTGRAEFLKIDKLAVQDFATACKAAGVRHFELLGSVGASATSNSFYLRSKGELEDGIRALDFERLSLFRPSMILTPTNRYGVLQALTLAVWPWLQPLLLGSLRKARGVRVENLGRAMANNIRSNKSGSEILHWDDFVALSAESTALSALPRDA